MTRASWMLVLVTALWGMSFAWTKSWQVAASASPIGDLLSSLTLIGVRMLLALALLALFRPRLFVQPRFAEHAAGAAIGASFFLGFLLQTWGLATTTPALSAFFTSLASAWVPLFALLVGQRVRWLTLLGLAIAVSGCGVIVEGWSLGVGEWLTVVGSLFIAAELLLLDWLGQSLEPAHFTPAFLGSLAGCGLIGAVIGAAAGPGLAGWTRWTAGMLGQSDVLWSVLLLAAFPTVLAFHWMNEFQPKVPPSRAALIYLLEPVFSSLFSIWWGHDIATWPLAWGGALILAGNLLVELFPERKQNEQAMLCDE